MVTPRELLGGAMVLTAVPLAAMLDVAYRNGDSPGSRGFFLVLPGAMVWSLVSGVLALGQSVSAFRAVWGFHILAANLLALGWWLMALDYTRRERVALTRWQWAALLAVPAVGQVLYWTNGAHHLVVAAEPTVGAAGVVQFENGPWFYVHAAYNYVFLALTATAMLVRDYLRAEGFHRRQTTVLLVGAAVAVASSVGFTVDLPIPPYVDPAPFGYLVTTSLWTAAIFRFQLFTTVPIGREVAIDTIPDAFVLLDPNDRIVDVNEAGRALFDVETDPVGSSAADLLGEFPPVLEQFREGSADEHTVQVTDEGTTRYLSLTVQPVEYRGSENGTLVLAQDVTSVQRRQRDLELLQRVLSRVLRHNLRNDLQGIRGRAERIAAEADGEIASQAEVILDLADDLDETSEKARNIESVIETQDEIVAQDLVAIVDRAASAVERRHPEATIETDMPARTRVLGHYDLQDAVRNLAENAVVHADAPAPSATVTAERNDEWVRLDVVDDGPGIPEQELVVLDRHRETMLKHGRGAGLWLALIIAEKSGGDLTFSVSDGGTTASMKLPRAD